jgi:hypothetical protein
MIISLNNPHGGWDAWAIWNMRARFLFRAGSQWPDVFSVVLGWSHPDYPLLVSGNVARVWNAIGRDATAVPIALAFIFTFSTVGLMVCSLSRIKSNSIGLLAGMVLIGFVRFFRNGASQQADIPFAFYVLAVIACFYLGEQDQEMSREYFLLSGLLSGFAAWTKNEGLLLILSVMAAHLVATVPIKGWKCYSQELLPYLLGVFPMLMLIAYFKSAVVPPNDLVAGQGISSTLSRISDGSRYALVAKAYISTFGELIKSRILIFPLSILLLGIAWPRRHGRSVIFAATALFLMLSGYSVVYITTPHDLEWHLSTSVERLFIHILPASIFLFFSLLRTDGEAPATRSVHPGRY